MFYPVPRIFAWLPPIFEEQGEGGVGGQGLVLLE